MKIRPVIAEFFHADGHPDMTELIVAAPKISRSHIVHCNGVIFTRNFVKIRPVAQTCSVRHTHTDRQNIYFLNLSFSFRERS